MRYVIKNDRLKDYLFILGFDYEQVVDRTGRQDFVYLFNVRDGFHEALSFFTEFGKEHRNIDISTSK